MSFYYAKEEQAFLEKWKKLSAEYIGAGMTVEDTWEMYNFDRELFCKERTYVRHNQEFPAETIAEESFDERERTMKKVEIFHNIEFGSVRVLEAGDRLLFCRNDVAAALGYRDPRKAVARYCKEVVKRPILSKGGAQETIVIPAGHAYRMIVGSKLPDAQRFEHWLFSEVVPSIRKHGAYIMPDKIDEIKDDPEALSKLAAALEQERNKVERLNQENVALQNKAVYYDYFCEVGLCTNISTTAKELNIPTKQFVEFLLRGRFLYRTIRGVLLPCSETLTEGLSEVKDFCVNGHHGVYTLITPGGKARFRLLIPERNSNMGSAKKTKSQTAKC